METQEGINECIFSMWTLSKDEENRKEWTYESKQIIAKKWKEKNSSLKYQASKNERK